MKRKVALLVATALSLSFAGFAHGAKNSSKVVVPSATAAGPLTVISATQNPSTLQNEVVATMAVTGVTADTPGQDLVCGDIFDDGTLKVSQCLNVPVGTTVTLKFDLKWTGPIGQLAPGVGLEVTDDTSPATAGTGPLIASVDPLQLTVEQIPTLSPAMLGALALLLLGGGIWMQRRRKA
jgi:hypothetical protein